MNTLMTTLMIHNLRREYFELPLERYRLSFDDGLFAHYYYLPLLEGHPAPLGFFITTGFIRPGPARPMFDGRHLPFTKSRHYMYQAMIEGRREMFMTEAELERLAARPNVFIGAHSHRHDVILTRTHPRRPKPPSPWKRARFAAAADEALAGFSIRSQLAFQGYRLVAGRPVRRSRAQWEEDVKRDTEACLQWFADRLGITPQDYCFPFNEYSGPLVEILKAFGFRRFWGARAPAGGLIRPRVDIDRLLEEGDRGGKAGFR